MAPSHFFPMGLMPEYPPSVSVGFTQLLTWRQTTHVSQNLGRSTVDEAFQVLGADVRLRHKAQLERSGLTRLRQNGLEQIDSLMFEPVALRVVRRPDEAFALDDHPRIGPAFDIQRFGLWPIHDRPVEARAMSILSRL